MNWKTVGVGVDEKATLEVWMDSTGGFHREHMGEDEAALAHVSPEMRKQNFIRIRVNFLPGPKVVEMRVPVGERRDPELSQLFKDPANIRGFIQQAQMMAEQTAEGTETPQ